MRHYQQMAIFAKVVELKSFTGAARALGLPKSTVSVQISRLEEHLGVRLLQRSTRSLSITAPGASYYDYCARLVELADQANTEIGRMQERPTGLLRITAPVNFGAVILSPLAVTFLKRHPDLTIELLLLDRRVNLIEEGVDLAFRLGPMRGSSLVARSLGTIRHRLCAAPGYVERHPLPTCPKDLRDHECLPHGLRESWKFVRDGEGKTLTIKGRFSVNNLQGIRNAALAGLGIVRLPDYMCSEDLRTGRLIEILEDWPEPPTECRAVYPAKRHLPRKVRSFLDFVVETLDGQISCDTEAVKEGVHRRLQAAPRGN
jgi:DNA-binding transcriptional LysR family regulator